MEENLSYYTDLITRYFAGEAMPDEMDILSGWMRKDPANLRLFEEYRNTWLATEKVFLDKRLDIDEEWSRFRSRMPSDPKERGNKVVYMTPRRQENILNRRFLSRIAAALVILAVSASAVFYLFSRPSTIFISAGKGNIEHILPDGSSVALCKGASISYPADFNGKTRNVILTGQAYFKVQHDESRPFIVAAEEARIEVLGTAFNVNQESSSGMICIVLDSGKISLYDKDNPSDNVILMPGEKAEISRSDHSISKSVNSDPNITAWKTGRLKFNNTELSQVVETLNNYYHNDIRLTNNNLGACRLTATFDNQSLASVLNVLKGTLDLQIQTKGSSVEISGKPCL